LAGAAGSGLAEADVALDSEDSGVAAAILPAKTLANNTIAANTWVLRMIAPQKTA
jgi:hypothetical protein